ncbi:MAG: hypothetical protein WAV73_01745 [Candidatus Moraniibacteriota bacterium]
MKNETIKMGRIGLALLTLVFSMPQLVFAVEEQQVSLALDQAIFSFAAKPGEERELEINVGNLVDKKQLVSLEVNDLSIEENNRLGLIVAENSLFGMKDWLFTEDKKWIFEPKETKKITLKLKVPKDVTVGSHYAGIFFRALPEIQGENFQTVLVGAQVGSYVLLNVDGAVTGGGKINNFQVPVVAKERTDLSVEFENTGNIHYIPHGEIQVKNLLSQKTEKIEVEKHFVFPGKKYVFENNWQGGSVFGVYSAKAYFVDGNKVGHFSRRWIMGKYAFVWPFFLVGLFFVFRLIRKNGFWRRRKNG